MDAVTLNLSDFVMDIREKYPKLYYHFKDDDYGDPVLNVYMGLGSLLGDYLFSDEYIHMPASEAMFKIIEDHEHMIDVWLL